LIKINYAERTVVVARMTEYMTAAEAARRLGVKPATLYAYVSRGVLNRDKAEDGRGSLFDAEEIERLARRGRPRRPAGTADLTVESAITEITADRLRYRGLDAIRLATSHSFEDVAELLWTGQLPPASAPRATEPARGPHAPRSLRASRGARTGREAQGATLPAPAGAGPWRATPAALAAGRAAQAALPAGTLPLERFQVIVPAMAATDPLRLQLDPAAVLADGRSIIAGLVDCLPPVGAEAGDQADLAGRLWPRLCDHRGTPALRRALSAALVLLADHELAASTLAARVAASVRADPYAVVTTGLGAMSGALHGGASLAVEAMLAAASGPQDVPRVVGELLRRGERVPGFGHQVYRVGDPRGVLLLDLVRRAAPKSAQLAVAEAVLAEVRQKSLPLPNSDFALATLVRVAGMIRGSGEAVFAVARTAGWIAHAVEAYAGPGPLRLRAVYTGRPAVSDP
jgi:citrate synthase